jgi:hypothetical protein
MTAALVMIDPQTVRRFAAGLLAMLALTAGAAAGQTPTRVTPPKNKYTPADDVRLGQEAVDQIREQVPMLTDGHLQSYLDALGQRLVVMIPPGLEQSAFVYTFEVADKDDINAFALPGGPMFVHRGLMAVAKTEGELAGVMAHEVSHVVLRHGTAQQTKAERFQIGALFGQVLGAIVGGTTGDIIAQGSNFGVSAYFMKFSREYEKQADFMGAQIMARAGYDPRDMANMFRTIEEASGASGPQWLSDHPNPGNRVDYITREAEVLAVEGTLRRDTAFVAMQAHLSDLPPAAEGPRTAAVGTAPMPAGNGPRDVPPVEPPSARTRNYETGRLERITVPANWQQRSSADALMFAPEDAFFEASGTTTFTHGIEVGTADGQTRDLRRDTQALVQNLARSNPQLRPSNVYRTTTVDGRRALATTMDNASEITGQPEQVALITTTLRDGTLFYLIAVAPRSEAAAYSDAFARVGRTLRLRD